MSDREGAAPATSPLELLHPAGMGERVLLAGARCRPNLIAPHAAPVGSAADVAVIAPSPRQLAQRGWVARNITTAAGALAQDGVMYALLPPAVRAVAGRRLRALGLDLASPLARLPAGAPRYLVPLEARPWRHMLGSEVGAHAHVRRGLVAAAALPFGTRVLAESMPGVALVARRPGAAPLAAWLGRLRGETGATEHVATMTSWRGPAGPVVLFCFADGDDAPWGIAKLSPDSAREAQRLDSMGPAVRAAGARLPRLLATGAAGDRPVLVASVVEGRSAARALMASPELFADVAGRVADWLERWNGATARATPAPVERLECELLRHELPASYRAWLADRCAALAGTTLPLVAVHNDLTMWNVRLHASGPLGILDWAEAEGDALPLGDLFYAVADAAAACDGYRDRLAALRACFEPSGARATTVAPLSERLRTRLGLSPAAAELCFHACWLRHAGNERSRNAAARPFAEIARWLADRTATP